MDGLQKNPVKLYIQDIYRATRTENKYIFELFGLRFKNIMIHGVVTTFSSSRKDVANFEVSDPTGSIQVYYDSNCNRQRVAPKTMKDLVSSFATLSRRHDDNVPTMSSLLDVIDKKYKNPVDFKEGSYVSVVGDIFTDQSGVRNVSAYSCKNTSIQRDIIWMEELYYLYKKYYLKKPVDSG